MTAVRVGSRWVITSRSPSPQSESTSSYATPELDESDPDELSSSQEEALLRTQVKVVDLQRLRREWQEDGDGYYIASQRSQAESDMDWGSQNPDVSMESATSSQRSDISMVTEGTYEGPHSQMDDEEPSSSQMSVSSEHPEPPQTMDASLVNGYSRDILVAHDADFLNQAYGGTIGRSSGFPFADLDGQKLRRIARVFEEFHGPTAQQIKGVIMILYGLNWRNVEMTWRFYHKHINEWEEGAWKNDEYVLETAVEEWGFLASL